MKVGDMPNKKPGDARDVVYSLRFRRDKDNAEIDTIKSFGESMLLLIKF